MKGQSGFVTSYMGPRSAGG